MHVVDGELADAGRAGVMGGACEVEDGGGGRRRRAATEGSGRVLGCGKFGAGAEGGRARDGESAGWRARARRDGSKVQPSSGPLPSKGWRGGASGLPPLTKSMSST